MRTDSTLPERAALISTVSPSGVDSAFASAPASSSALTRSALPDVAASESGEAPNRFVVAAFAPAPSRSFTASTSFQCAAQCSAVVPSGCGALTLTRLLTIARRAAMSFRCAASAASDARRKGERRHRADERDTQEDEWLIA